MGFFLRVAVFASISLLSTAIANNDEIVEKNGKAYMRLKNGTLVPIQRALPVEEETKGKKEIPKALPYKEGEDAPVALPLDTSPTPKANDLAPVETKASEILLDADTIKSMPLEHLDLSEIEKDEESHHGLGIAGLIIAAGSYAARRLSYLKQHPGIRANNELEKEIKRLDGFVKRINAFGDKLGIGTKILGNKIVLFFKNGKSPQAQISRLKSEMKGLALEWKKEIVAFDRLEARIDAEHLKRRQQVYLDLDKELTELKARRATARSSVAKGFVNIEVSEELNTSEAVHKEAITTLKKSVEYLNSLDRRYRALNDIIQGSGDSSKHAIHPLVVENREVFEELKAEAAHYRTLKYEAFSKGQEEKLAGEIKASEEKLVNLRAKASAALEKSYESESENRALDIRIAEQDLAAAKKRLSIAHSRYQLEVKEFSIIKANALTSLDREIENTEDTIRVLHDLETQGDGHIAEHLPFRVNEKLPHEDPEAKHRPNPNFVDLDLARSRLELAIHTTAQDGFNKEAIALNEMSEHMLTSSLDKLGSEIPKISKLKESDYWINELRKETLLRIGKKYQTFDSEALRTNESFLRLLAGDDQSVNPDDAELARAVVHETMADLDSELHQGRKAKNPWYHDGSSTEELDHLYRVTKKLRPIADRGSKIDETKRLSASKKDMANGHSNLRFDSAADVAGRVPDPTKSRMMAEAATSTAAYRPKGNLGTAIMGCLVKLRHQVAAF